MSEIKIKCGKRVKTIKLGKADVGKRITIFTLGNEKWLPSEEDFARFKMLLEKAMKDPSFVLIYPDALQVQQIYL